MLKMDYLKMSPKPEEMTVIGVDTESKSGKHIPLIVHLKRGADISIFYTGDTEAIKSRVRPYHKYGRCNTAVVLLEEMISSLRNNPARRLHAVEIVGGKIRGFVVDVNKLLELLPSNHPQYKSSSKALFQLKSAKTIYNDIKLIIQCAYELWDKYFK